MKKVSLLALLLATVGASAVSAETIVPGCPKAFQGFHLGGNIGYDVGRGRLNQTLTRTFLDGGVLINGTSQSRTTNTHLGFQGVDGGVGVGYTHRFCNWALGIAFDANWANTKGKHHHAETLIDPTLGTITTLDANKVRLRNSLQLYARAGYVIGGQVMPFIGLGWDNSKWKHSFSSSDVIPSPVGGQPLLVDGSTSQSKRLNSLLWKLGVDFLATKHCILGFEYTGTSGRRFKKTEAALSPENIDLISTNNVLSRSFKPQNNKFALTFKVIY